MTVTAPRTATHTSVGIRISPGTDGTEPYRALLSVDGGSDVDVPFRTPADMERFAGVFERDATAAERQAAGEALFEALLGGALNTIWRDVLAAADPDRPARLCLDVRPTELRHLPWELLRSDGRWLFRRPDLLCRRGTVAAGAAEPDPQEELGPLRALVVLCNPREHRLLAEKELAWISGTFDGLPGATHVEVLDGPSRAELADGIDQLRPHILHFIGHGMPLPGRGTALNFNWRAAPDGPRDWSLDAGQIADLTRWQPHLVVLNACRTTDSGPAVGTGERVRGLADAFLDAGARAAVSVQADVDSPDAVIFSSRLYRAIGGGTPLDEAVALARTDLARHEERPSDAWALPVLMTRTAPEEVLPIVHTPPPPSTVDAIRRHGTYERLRRFVGRSAERRAAWWALDPPVRGGEPGTGHPVLVISGHSETGAPQTGKSLLADWCLAVCFLRGHRAVSVNLSGGARDWLTVLREIRLQVVSEAQLTPLPAEAFADFDAALERLLPAAPGTGGAEDGDPLSVDGPRFDDEAGRADERRHEIVDRLLGGLSKGAGGAPMVITLDQADRIQAELFTGWLYERLVLPIARGDAAPLRLVLVASREWVADALPRADRHLIGEVSLGDFESSQLMRLVRAFGNRLGYPVDERVQNIVMQLQEMNPYTRVDIFGLLMSVFSDWYSAAERGA
ncbi:CHAT domain-containing protein [Streptomyces sp. SID8352]|uniref:CHAT domain-containing protein n=1 Tax=Streptomyces sp. SID8352 TaxID=2690338 RepID=UPI0013720454|nr:CHAT domain-containing protein [Streptomyces sp. SID8352]